MQIIIEGGEGLSEDGLAVESSSTATPLPSPSNLKILKQLTWSSSGLNSEKLPLISQLFRPVNRRLSRGEQCFLNSLKEMPRIQRIQRIAGH